MCNNLDILQIHIGFLDFTLFPEVPEFYATNLLMNIKNHHVFSSKFRLYVVDLSKIDLATEEDKYYEIKADGATGRIAEKNNRKIILKCKSRRRKELL